MAFVEALHPGRRDAEIFDTVGLAIARTLTPALTPALTLTLTPNV